MDPLRGSLNAGHVGISAEQVSDTSSSYDSEASDTSRDVVQDGNSGEAESSGRSGPPSRLMSILDAVRNPTAQPASEESTAANAERHRLANSVGIDLAAVASWFEKTAPFLMLLFILFLYRHIVGIVAFAALHLILANANEQTRKQAALKGDRMRWACLSLAAVMTTNIGAALLVLRKQQLWLNFLLVGLAPVPSAWDVLFRVAIADMLVRYWGIVLKAFVLVLHGTGSRLELRKRSQALTVVEHGINFYRGLLATPVWYQFFLGGEMGTVLAHSCCGLYMMLKSTYVYERGQLLVVSTKALLTSSMYYTKAATPAELCEAGNQCSICQETMVGPIKLHCGHIYCDSCISEWFERERTCPMCRAVVQPPGVNAHGDASTSLLPTLF